MKRMLFLICTMLLSCASVVYAQNSTEKIEFTGKLINPTTNVQDYIVRVCEVGNYKYVLAQVKPEEDGSFYIAVESDKAVRFMVLDKKKKTIIGRSFFGTEDNHKLEMNEIDLQKDNSNKTRTNP